MALRTLTRQCMYLGSHLNLTQAASYSSFKSSISLDKLYPKSTLDMTKSQKPPENSATKFGGYIPMNKIKITQTHSSGPGGQNVNTSNTKIDLRFKLSEADWLPEVIRQNMQIKLRSHITKEGFFMIQSDRTRSAHLNTADALEKLREFIRSCEPQEPKELSEETLEKIRRAQEKATRERLREKKERHFVKSSRGSASVSDI